MPSLCAKVCSSDGIDVEFFFVISYKQAFIRFKKMCIQAPEFLPFAKSLVFRPKVSKKGLFFYFGER